MRVFITLLFLTLSLFAGIGKVAALNGNAEVLRGGEQLNVSIGFELEEQDRLTTSDNTKAQIIFNDKTIISIGANSDFNIKSYIYKKSSKKSKATFGFAKGIFKTITGKIGKINPDRFKLKTSNATIGIRGTAIYMNVAPNKPDFIACTHGKIDVTSNQFGGTVLVEKGNFTKVSSSDKPTPALPYKASDVSALDKAPDKSGDGESAREQENEGEQNTETVMQESVEEVAEAAVQEVYDEHGFNAHGIHAVTGTRFDPRGFDVHGFNQKGFNIAGIHAVTGTPYDPKGFDTRGFNVEGIHAATGTLYDPRGFDTRGFNVEGIHAATGTLYGPNGYDARGFDDQGIHALTGTQYGPAGYDADGYNAQRFHLNGIHADTGTPYNPAGFNVNNIHADTGTEYNPAGFNVNNIHAATGTEYNPAGFNVNNIHAETGTEYNPAGFNVNNIHADTGTEYNPAGFNVNNIHAETGTEYNPTGFNVNNIHADTGTEYNPAGFNVNNIHAETGTEYNPAGFNVNSIHAATRTEYNPAGFNVNNIHAATGTEYNPAGFNVNNIHADTGTEYNPAGFNVNNIHADTGTEYNPAGFNVNNIHAETGTEYNPAGFDVNNLHVDTGTIYNLAGYNVNGYNALGYDINGFNSDKRDLSGYHQDNAHNLEIRDYQGDTSPMTDDDKKAYYENRNSLFNNSGTVLVPIPTATLQDANNDNALDYGYWSSYDMETQVIETGTYVRGDLTSVTDYDSLRQQEVTASYSGGVVAYVSDNGAAATRESGTINLNVNFKSQKISGSMAINNFNPTGEVTTIKPHKIVQGSFATGINGSPTDAFGLPGGTSADGSINGKFYGKDAAAVGGSFNVTREEGSDSKTAVGVYGAGKNP
jgi:hypothetical protein